jgi:hypothetical protein
MESKNSSNAGAITTIASTTTPPASLPSSHICSYCSNVSAASRCSRCCLVYYCSQSCQANDWKKHKLSCIPIQKQTFSNLNQSTKPNGNNENNSIPSTPAAAPAANDSSNNSSPANLSTSNNGNISNNPDSTRTVQLNLSLSSTDSAKGSLAMNFPISMQNVPNFLSAAVTAAVNDNNDSSNNSFASLNKKFESMEKDLQQSLRSSSARKAAKSTNNQFNASAQTPHFNSLFSSSTVCTGSYSTVPYPLPAPLHSNNINPVYIPPCRPILRTSHLYFPLGNIPPLSSINAISAALFFPSLSGKDYLQLPPAEFPAVRILYCDIGDCRHLFQSFVDLALKIRMKKLAQKAPLEVGGGVEFFINDHEPRIIARTILLLVATALVGQAIQTPQADPSKVNTNNTSRFNCWSASDHACFLFQLYGSFQLTLQQQRRLRYILHKLILLSNRQSKEEFSNHHWTNWLELLDSGTINACNLIWQQWLTQCCVLELKSVEPMWRAPDGVDKEAAKHLNYYYRTGTILVSQQFIKAAPLRSEIIHTLNEQGIIYEREQEESSSGVTNNSSLASVEILPPSREEYENVDSYVCNPTLLPIDFHESKQKFLFSRDPYSPLLPKLTANLFQQCLDIWTKYAQAVDTILNYNESVNSRAAEQQISLVAWFRLLISSRDLLYHLHVSTVLYDRILVYHQPEYTGLQPLILLARSKMNGANSIIETSINFPSCFTLSTSNINGNATYSPDLHKFCLLALNANVKLVKNMMGLDMELYNYSTARVCVCRFNLSDFSSDLTAPKGHISDGFRVLNDWFMTASTPILMHDEFAKIDQQQLEMLRMSTPRSVANMRTFMLFVSTVITNNIVQNSAFRQRLTALFSTLLAPKNPFLCDYTFASFMTHLGLLKQQLTPLFSFVLCPNEETNEKQMKQHALFYTSLSKLQLCEVQFNLPCSMGEMSKLLSTGLSLDNNNPSVKESVLSLLIVTCEDRTVAESTDSGVELLDAAGNSVKEGKDWVQLRDMNMLHWLRSKGRDVQLLDAFTYDAHNHTAQFWIHTPYINYAKSCKNAVIALMDFDRLHLIGQPVQLTKLTIIQDKDNGMKPI